MNERALPARLALGIVLSICLHVALLLPGLAAVMSAEAHVHHMSSSFDPRDIAAPQPPEQEQQIELGMEDADAPSLTWIGYEEYEEHLAQLAEFDQAAFRENPAAQESPDMTSSSPPLPVEASGETASAGPNARATETESDATMEVELAEADFEEVVAPIVSESDPTTSAAGVPSTISFDASSILAMFDDSRSAPGVQADESKTQAPNEGDPQLTDAGAAAAAKAETAKQTPSPVNGAAAAASHADPGAQAEKESDAFSKIKVTLEEMKLGKPIVRKGIEIQPRRPQFSLVTLLTATPRNPLVEIRFQSNGRPAAAKLITSSGDERVDHPIERSLYEWRAKGKALSQLKESETLNVRIRIVINPYVRDDDDDEEETTP